VVNIMQKKDFLAARDVTGVLDSLFSLFSPGFGNVVLTDSCVHIDACRLVMGSIEVEESIVAQPRGVRNSIQNLLNEKFRI